MDTEKGWHGGERDGNRWNLVLRIGWVEGVEAQLEVQFDESFKVLIFLV